MTAILRWPLAALATSQACDVPADWPRTSTGTALTEYFACLSTSCHDADPRVFDGGGDVTCLDVVSSGAPCDSNIPGANTHTVSELCPEECDLRCQTPQTSPGPQGSAGDDTAASLQQELDDARAREALRNQEQQTAVSVLEQNRTAEQQRKEAADRHLVEIHTQTEAAESARRQAEEEAVSLQRELATSQGERSELQQEVSAAQSQISELQRQSEATTTAPAAATPAPAVTGAPVTTPVATQAPVTTPVATLAPVTTPVAAVTDAPDTTVVPPVTEAPGTTVVPASTEVVATTPAAVVTEVPVTTALPVSTEGVVTTPVAVVTEVPVTTVVPVVTAAPVTTEGHAVTATHVVTEGPRTSEAPVVTARPTTIAASVATAPSVGTTPSAPVVTAAPTTIAASVATAPSVGTTPSAVTSAPVVTEAPPDRPRAAIPYDTLTGEVGRRVAALICAPLYPKVIALFIGSVGLLSILDAPRFAQCMAVGVASIVAGVLVSDEAILSWRGDLSDIQAWVVAVEAGAIMAAAAFVGFDGFRFVMGACSALGLLHVAAGWASIFTGLPQLTINWFALSAILGVSVMYAGKEVACAVIGPIMGGLMVAVSIVFLGFELAGETVDSPCWVDFADVLLSSDGAARAFGGAEGLMVARGLGFAIWALVASAGFYWYMMAPPPMSVSDRIAMVRSVRRVEGVDPQPRSRPSVPVAFPVSDNSEKLEPLLPRPAPAPPQTPSSNGGSRSGRSGGMAAPPPFKFSGGGR